MTSGHNIAMSLRAAYWAMHRQADAFMSRHGVTANQFVLLSLLAETDGITQQELVRRASSDANTVRAMLLLLEQGGLVSRATHPQDKRARSVALTARGRRVYQRLVEMSEPFRTSLIGLFQPDEEAQLCSLLNRIGRWEGPEGEGDNQKQDRTRRGRMATAGRKAAG